MPAREFNECFIPSFTFPSIYLGYLREDPSQVLGLKPIDYVLWIPPVFLYEGFLNAGRGEKEEDRRGRVDEDL